ncbi:MAG: TIM barrel protein, partial [Coriobacteriales bacterium]
MKRSWLIVPDFNRLEESVALAREFGAAFEYDDFYAPAVYEDVDEVERRVAAYLALERDTSADTLHGVFFDIKPNSLDSAIAQRSRALMRQSLAIANRLGVRGVVFHSDIYGGMRLSIPPEVWLDSAEGLFRQLCAENRDLSIYLENTIEQEPDQLVALAQRMADVPNFALALDYAHASLSATDGERWLREMGPFVRHVHLNDNDLYADRHWPVGEGSIDYPRFAALAERYIPGVPMLMEVRTLEDARESLEAMEALRPVGEAAPAVDVPVADAPAADAPLDIRMLQEVLETGIELTRQKDSARLLDTILTKSMGIANCDGGTLYVLKDSALHFKIMKTRSMGVDRGGNGEDLDMPPVPMQASNVSAWAALNARAVSIDNVYDEHDEFDFSGPKRFDEQTGYRTRSVLAVPLMDSSGQVLGVMQLINAQDERGQLCSFAPERMRLLQALASQAAVAMRQMAYIEEIRAQMWSFTSAMAAAIDQRTPYNGSHTRKVAHYAGLIAQRLDALAADGQPGGEPFSRERTDQLMMAALLHDIGKMVIPTSVMDKPTRLGCQLPAVLTRLEMLEDKQRLAFFEGRLQADELEEALAALEQARQLVEELNTAGFVPAERADELRCVGKREFWAGGERVPCLEPQAVELLCIAKGTL